MNMFKDKQCILCPYKKEENCIENHNECYSLSNIYYGRICKFFPFKQIEKFKTELEYRNYERNHRKEDEKYGDYTLENDDLKFIWGITTWNDLSGSDANLYTMNDIDIFYDKTEDSYILGIETAYCFEDYEGECNYLKDCLRAFTKYMDDNNLNKNEPYLLFMSDPHTSMTAKTIEELYINFKIFVNGYCSLQETEDKN